MPELIEIGTISTRGQIAIPSDMRKKMHLKDGEKVIFILQDDALVMKKVSDMSWEEITKPLRDAPKKIQESDVNALVHRLRKR